MDGRFNSNLFISEQEENDTTPENSSESPPSTTFNDMKMTSTSSPKKRRAMQKRVVSVPIKEIDGLKLKGESGPPSDSWAWRKYGQKPIKGSPYPRGYYRCSSSKGCPARKRVERSSVDPTMLVITYSCEHNHPWRLPSGNHHHHHTKSTKAEPQPDPGPEPEPEPEAEPEPEEKFTGLGDGNTLITMNTDEFTWFGEMETTMSTILESPMFTESSSSQGDSDNMSMFFPMREEDESLFADLGELPECSMVFRHRNLEPEVQIF